MNPVILSDNVFAEGTPAATDTAEGGYDVLYIRDRKTYTSHRFASDGTKYYTVDCGAARAVDTLSLVGHNLGTAEATVSVEGSDDDFVSDVNEVLAGFEPGDDYALMKAFTAAAYRYWRVKLVTAGVAAEATVVLLGRRLELPYPPDAPYVHYDEGAEVQVSSSAEENHLLGVDLMNKEARLEIRVSMVDREFVTDTFKPWWNDYAIHRKPFALAVDLDAFPGDVLYGQLPKDYRFRMPLKQYGLAESLEVSIRARLER
jgi:hypothetical protein